MNADEALAALTGKIAETVHGVLSSLSSEPVEMGEPTVFARDESPFESIAYPAVATDISYTNGVTGSNVFALTRLGARRLAAAMTGGNPPSEDDGQDLDDDEMSALGEAMNKMMAAAAAALATALGYPVDISVSTTRTLESPHSASVYLRTPHATGVSFTVLGEPCRLLQLVPNAFVVRVARGLGSVPAAPQSDAIDDRILAALRDTPVRVTGELGCAEVTLRALADIRPGQVIELDRNSDDLVDLCVNGRAFAVGRLLVDGSQWAIRVERLLDVDPTDYMSTVGRVSAS